LWVNPTTFILCWLVKLIHRPATIPLHVPRKGGIIMSDDQEPADDIVDARLSQVKARFGDRFDDAQWNQIRKQIADSIKQANRLRAVPMGNADEPEIVFVPYRADDSAWSAR
jgi:hypothetical protein